MSDQKNKHPNTLRDGAKIPLSRLVSFSQGGRQIGNPTVEDYEQDGKQRRIIRDATLASDRPILRNGFYYEVLLLGEGNVDLSRFNPNGIPLQYYSHSAADRKGPEGHVGRVINPRIVSAGENRELRGDLVFHPSIPESAEALARVADGLLSSLSIGWEIAAPFREAVEFSEDYQVLGSDTQVERIVYRLWRPTETTLTPLPADETSQIRSSEDRGKFFSLPSEFNSEDNPQSRASSAQKEQHNMSDKDNVKPEGAESEAAANAATGGERTTSGENQAKAAEQTRAASREKPVEKDAVQDASPNLARAIDNMTRAGVEKSKMDSLVNDFASGECRAGAFYARMNDLMGEAQPKVEPANGRTYNPEVLSRATGDKRRYNLARAIEQAAQGTIFSGDSIESEAHFKCKERNVGRKLQTREVLVPQEFLSHDPDYVRGLCDAIDSQVTAGKRSYQEAEGAKKLLARTVEAGSATTGALRPDIDYNAVIRAPYAPVGIFSRIGRLPGLLNQNFAVPRENMRPSVSWVGEKATITDNSDGVNLNDELMWKYKRVQAKAVFTGQIMDQAPIVYRLITQSTSEAIPQGINQGILTGSGSATTLRGVLDILADAVATNTDGTQSKFPPTPLGTSFANNNTGGKMTYDNVVALRTQLMSRNTRAFGSPVYFANEALYGRMQTTRIDSGSGLFLLRRDGDRRLIGDTEVVVDNNIPKLDGNKRFRATEIATANTTATLHALLCLIPEELVMGFFSDMSMLVDPYTDAGTDLTNVYFRQACDYQPLHFDSISGYLDVQDA